MEPLACGCIIVGNSRSYTLCREGHGTGKAAKAPAPVKPTKQARPQAEADPERERKNAEARESGRRLKPGRWRWHPDNSMEKVSSDTTPD